MQYLCSYIKPKRHIQILSYTQMSQAGGRTSHINDTTGSSVPHRRERIALSIVVDLSRLVPPNIILAEFQQLHGTPSLTDFPLMHFVQTRDLLLEVDEIKKATQHEIWNLFNTWHPRSSFHLTLATYCHDTRCMISEPVSYEDTLEDVINRRQLQTQHSPIKFLAIPNDHWCLWH